uniref:Putative 15-hydroxyprostaglandin dehydrogenase n=1 Tax=Panstrongylus lignarius TaxID=156445 RepID=A0A224XGQ0_9HEMI
MAGFKNLFKRQQLTHLFEARRTNTCSPIFKECGVCSKYVYMDPKCKIALVTGGTTGIGFATAQELLCNDLYRVVLTDMDTCKGKEAVEKLNSQHGEHKACFMQLDTYKEKHFCDVIQKVIKLFGNLDILINNPGIPRKKTWEEEVNSKVMSTIRGTMMGTELMSKQKLRRGGVIINLASALAFENFPGAPIYVSSNNGVIGFSKAWGATQNYLISSVRVVSMCPGITEGLIIENTAAPEDKEAQASLSQLPAQKASSVGRGIVYLVQHAPSGTVWFVDGGVLYRGRIPHRLDYSEKIRYV